MLSGFSPVSVLAAEPRPSVTSWPALRTFVRAVHKCSPTPLDTATQLAPAHPHPAHFTICCPLTLWSQLDYKTCGGKNSQAPQTASSPSPDLLCTTIRLHSGVWSLIVFTLPSCLEVVQLLYSSCPLPSCFIVLTEGPADRQPSLELFHHKRDRGCSRKDRHTGSL